MLEEEQDATRYKLSTALQDKVEKMYERDVAANEKAKGRGLHSFPSQLNLSAFYGIGGARRDCVARVKGVLGGVYGVQGVFCVSDTAQVELKSEQV